MKANTASPGLKDGMRHQMIHIYQHRRQQEEIILFPMLPVIDPGYECREDEVEEVVDEGLEQSFSYELRVVSSVINSKLHYSSNLIAFPFYPNREGAGKSDGFVQDDMPQDEDHETSSGWPRQVQKDLPEDGEPETIPGNKKTRNCSSSGFFNY